MKESALNLFGGNILRNKVMIKLWDEKRKKWYFKIVDVKKEEKSAIISYNELLKAKCK